jgi:two-component system, OmpR family, response regulator RpaA
MKGRLRAHDAAWCIASSAWRNVRGEELDQPRKQMSFNTRTIMVVDDDDDLRTMVEGLLRRAGYVVVGVASGYEAHPLALQTLPALIILDIGMPGMDGLTTLWKMRKHDELATVPVIILTAYESYDLRGEAASVGCHNYLTKPFEPAALKALVNQLLS